jgi:hypothetical protein
MDITSSVAAVVTATASANKQGLRGVLATKRVGSESGVGVDGGEKGTDWWVGGVIARRQGLKVRNELSRMF